jgi:hypothetical protein
MSIEYFGSPTPTLADGEVESLLERIDEDLQMAVVRRSHLEVGLAFSSERTLEAVTISVKPETVYVGFRNATRDQRDAVLTKLQTILEVYGRKCSFDEE